MRLGRFRLFVPILAWISLSLVTLPTLSYTTELANCFATCTPPWTASIASHRLFFHPESSSSVSALHCRILAAAPATFGAMCANATNFIHFRVASDQVGLRVHRSRALAKFFTPPYSIQHLQTLPTIHAQRRLRLLVTAPPITCNRSPARPDRAASSRLPTRLRPAVPPACRPNYPGCLAWTRLLPGCSARRLHSDMPCHTVLRNTSYTFWKFLELENFWKFIPNKTGNVSASENDCIFRTLRRPFSGWNTWRLQEAFKAYASLTAPVPTPLRCNLHFSGPLFMGDVDNVRHKAPRVGNAASMEFNLASAPVTPSSMLRPPSDTPPATSDQPHMWGSLMALPEDVDGAVLAARVKQLLTSITMTAFVRVSPINDQVPPFEPRFARQAVASFLHEHLTADDLTSVVLGTIKSGAARPITLAEYPVSDGQIYAVDFNLNLASAVNSQFIKNMLANLDATLNSPLSPDQQHLWFKFVPEDASHSFSLLLMPSIRADQSGLIAFSTLTPAQVRKDVCQFLQVPNLEQLPVAVYARATGTEIISLEPGLLARVIKGVSHLGTPANSGANYTLCKPIRELPAIVTNRSDRLPIAHLRWPTLRQATKSTWTQTHRICLPTSSIQCPELRCARQRTHSCLALIGH
jgi:hypothetical protein